MIAWPWTAKRRAARQLAAMHRWFLGSSSVIAARLGLLGTRAEGYFAARDWTGVEAAYLDARKVVDTWT